MTTLRILVFSTLFPSPAQPTAGVFIRERMFRVGRRLLLDTFYTGRGIAVAGKVLDVGPGSADVERGRSETVSARVRNCFERRSSWQAHLGSFDNFLEGRVT